MKIFSLQSSQLFFGFFLTLFFLLGCGSTSLDQSFYAPKKPRYEIELNKNGQKNGREVWWFENGNKKYESTNKNGEREGEYKAWYSDGKLWYRGFQYHSLPESTLTYYHTNGKLKSEAHFRAGIQISRNDYDESGKLLGQNSALLLPGMEDEPEDSSLKQTQNLRNASLQIWSLRVRQAVENYWVLPKEFLKERPYRAVAKIKVGKDGKILNVTWLEKSPSSAFNTLANQTFKRIKRLPAFPPQVTDASLEVQYEFISLGKPVPRTKLEVRGTEPLDSASNF